MASELELFGLLVFGHMLGDYPLQGDFLSKAKNRYAPIAGVPWYQALGAHSAIHAGFVGIITGSTTRRLTPKERLTGKTERALKCLK